MNDDQTLPATIFVFGSNREGVHGSGAAKDAYEKYGAHWGKGEGLEGNSYAIPTRRFVGRTIKSLKLEEIEKHVQKFLYFARGHATLSFQVTRLGCGRAGYRDDQIAPFFKGAPENCLLPTEWEQYK